MARVGLSIVKRVSFRNALQEFSNVYYYSMPDPLPDASEATSLINTIVGIERPFHSTDVTFMRANVWSAGGGPGANNMIQQATLSGTGAGSPNTSWDRERAILVQIPAGRDTRGHKVYLRKWYHICGIFPGVTNSSQYLQQTAAFTDTDIAAMRTAINPILAPTVGGRPYVLVSKSGRPPDATAQVQPYKWLEHHQLGDMWR